MSPGFRVLLLMLFAFGAVWAYRFRSTDLYNWVYPSLAAPAEEGRDPLASTLDEVIEMDDDYACWAHFESQPRGSSRGQSLGLFPEAYAGVYSGELPQEAEQAWSDLPIEEVEYPEDLELGGVEVEGASQTYSSFEMTEGGGEAASGEIVEEVEENREAEGSSDAGDAGTVEPPTDPNPPVAFEEFDYEFQEGDSLWKVAVKLLGGGSHVQELQDLNRERLKGVDPSRIPVGTRLRIRRPIRQDSLKKPEAPDDSSVEGGSDPGPQVPEREPTLHTVQRNENLQNIAKRYYPGDSEGWKRIFEANKERLPSPDWIRQGQVLKIPAGPE